MPRRVSVSQPDVNLSLQSTVVTLEERIQRLERSLEHFAVSGARDRATTASPAPFRTAFQHSLQRWALQASDRVGPNCHPD